MSQPIREEETPYNVERSFTVLLPNDGYRRVIRTIAYQYDMPIREWVLNLITLGIGAAIQDSEFMSQLIKHTSPYVWEEVRELLEIDRDDSNATGDTRADTIPSDDQESNVSSSTTSGE